MRPMTRCDCGTLHLVERPCPTCTRRTRAARQQSALDAEAVDRARRAKAKRARRREATWPSSIDTLAVARRLGEIDGRAGIAPSTVRRFRGAGGRAAFRAYEAAYRRAQKELDTRDAIP